MGWRFAVSTLGMPGVPLPEVARVALDHGCQGIELRVHPDEEVHLGLRDVERVRSLFEGEGLELACLAGYAKVCAPGPDAPVIGELRALVELAHGLGAPAVRVFPGGDADAEPRIGAVFGDLRDSGVRLLVETHDSHPTGAAVAGLVTPFAAPGLVAGLWDAVHPWRAGEDPARTRATLGEYLAYFQVKDVASWRDPTPVVPGEGAVPLADCAGLLRAWSGWISLEWEKAWYPDLVPVAEPLRAAAAWFARYAPEAR